jgi:hypothetical protein
MPPRWACVLIVVTWLAVNGWLFYHDLLPRLLPGQPPPYTVDLLEEVQDRRWMRPVGWTVYHNDNKALSAKTHVEHPARDTFELVAEYRPVSGLPHARMPPLLVSSLTSRYRVNAAGDLLGLSIHLEGRPDFPFLRGSPLLQGRLPSDLAVDITGRAEATRLTLEAHIAGYEKPIQFPAVEARRGGAVLLPLHPVNRLRGLRAGQSWAMTVFDPIKAVVGSFTGSDGTSLARCRVRDEPEPFSHGRRNEVTCLVIDYESDDFTGTTRVARDTGLILSQEAVLGKNNRWAMFRD